jgi:hypothetical protein
MPPGTPVVKKKEKPNKFLDGNNDKVKGTAIPIDSIWCNQSSVRK